MVGEFKQRIVAFVDILGFKEKVITAQNNPDEAGRIFEALNRIYSLKKENDNKDIKEYWDIQVSSFSDSVVISYPAKGDNLFYLIIDLIHLQIDLVLQGVLIRGGLTIGDLYHDGNIVYGPAMNEAYKLESKIAVYPRIIVDEMAIRQYCQYCKDDIYALDDINSLLREDNDGLVFIDMLKQDQELNDDGTEYYDWLTIIRKIIIDGLKNRDLAVKVKYMWLKEYFNSIVSDDRLFFPIPESELYDETNGFRNAYKELVICSTLPVTEEK